MNGLEKIFSQVFFILITSKNKLFKLEEKARYLIVEERISHDSQERNGNISWINLKKSQS